MSVQAQHGREAAGPGGVTPPRPGRLLTGLHGAFSGSGARWLLGLPMLFILLLLLVPIGYIVVLALDHSNGRTGISQTLSDPIFRASLWRTFVLAAIVSALTMFFGTIYALGLAVAPRWLTIVMLIALFTIFWTSLLVRTYGWILLYLPTGAIYQVLHAVGLRHTPLDIYQTNFASYPAMVQVMMPYAVLPVFAATRQIDPTHVRAARVLGARPLLILRKVIFPSLRAGMVSGGVLVFIMSLGFYVTPTLLGSQTGQLVATLIGEDFSQPGQTPIAAAMSLVLLAIVIVVYLIGDRVFRVSEQWGGG